MNPIPLISKVNLPLSDIKINHQNYCFLIGSCFSQNIGNQLLKFKFKTIINPYGVMYNPISIGNALTEILENKVYKDMHLTHFGNKWLSLNHHSSFNDKNKGKCLTKINQNISFFNAPLKLSDTLIITFGTAWIYSYPDFGIVANCHKIPNKNFTKRLLNVGKIVEYYNDLIQKLQQNNPKLQIIFTVSPVRHIKEGLHENNLSKSVLHLAINNIIHQNNCCAYFPAYELLIDELRDYRFYKNDLAHPTDLAISYIWQKFIATYCNENTKKLISKIDKINMALQHKPFDFESKAHQKFIKTQINLMEEMERGIDFISFKSEKKMIKQNHV